MLRRKDLCLNAVEHIRAELVGMNGPITAEDILFEFEWPMIKPAVAQIISAAMNTREGLEHRRVMRMAIAIFRSEN